MRYVNGWCSLIAALEEAFGTSQLKYSTKFLKYLKIILIIPAISIHIAWHTIEYKIYRSANNKNIHICYTPPNTNGFVGIITVIFVFWNLIIEFTVLGLFCRKLYEVKLTDSFVFCGATLCT